MATLTRIYGPQLPTCHKVGDYTKVPPATPGARPQYDSTALTSAYSAGHDGDLERFHFWALRVHPADLPGLYARFVPTPDPVVADTTWTVHFAATGDRDHTAELRVTKRAHRCRFFNCPVDNARIEPRTLAMVDLTAISRTAISRTKVRGGKVDYYHLDCAVDEGWGFSQPPPDVTSVYPVTLPTDDDPATVPAPTLTPREMTAIDNALSEATAVRDDSLNRLVKYANNLSADLAAFAARLQSDPDATVNSLGIIQGRALDIDRECARLQMARDNLKSVTRLANAFVPES